MNLSNQKSQTNVINENKSYKYFKPLLYIIVITQLFLTLFTLTSCSSSDDDADFIAEDPAPEIKVPEINLINGSKDVFPGVVGGSSESILNHTIKADIPEGLVSLKISRVRDGVVTEYVTVSEGHPEYTEGMQSFTYQLDYILKEEDVDTKLFFRAEVLDEKGNTEFLDFAEANVKLPMIKASLALQASKNGIYNNFSPYYLYIKGNNIEAIPMPEATKEENDKDIAAILSFNDDSQYYIASPTDIDEIALTDGLLEISKTKFKKDDVFENGLDVDYNVLDTHEIEANFGALTFDEVDERVNNLKKDARFYFTTQDNRIAILQVKKIEPLGGNTIIAFDIFITQ
ncbi:hypothetical protein GTQ40_03210 [Flavobacteriaceae bacterium R38]|nr:hypothetical protein [Flavobacteriaceae bacterium R38]